MLKNYYRPEKTYDNKYGCIAQVLINYVFYENNMENR